MLNSAISTHAACFIGKVCGPLWSTWGAPRGEGKSRVKVGLVNTKVARRARAGQTPPPPPLCERLSLYAYYGVLAEMLFQCHQIMRNSGVQCDASRAWALPIYQHALKH